ncbi:hypothetical protein [Paenibacillus sp. NPDC058071]|uniref:hypothetical protein n=1 Tax=Paenibacillus sp. NPDC058071 TaxID=3346326 RepID=UPI0036D86B93
MLDSNNLRNIFINGSNNEKLDILEYLKDHFDSFNKNIEYFDEYKNVLLDFSITESDKEVKIEIFEALSKAAVFQDVSNINFDKLIENLENTPEECLSRSIDILSFTHEENYVPIIKRYLNHRNPYVRESAVFAVKEILEYVEKNSR